MAFFDLEPDAQSKPDVAEVHGALLCEVVAAGREKAQVRTNAAYQCPDFVQHGMGQSKFGCIIKAVDCGTCIPAKVLEIFIGNPIGVSGVSSEATPDFF